MGPFHLESVTAAGDRAVLRIDGDIDAYTAPQLRERMMDLAANATGQLLFLPLIARTAANNGWRAAAGTAASCDRVFDLFRPVWGPSCGITAL